MTVKDIDRAGAENAHFIVAVRGYWHYTLPMRWCEECDGERAFWYGKCTACAERAAS